MSSIIVTPGVYYHVMVCIVSPTLCLTRLPHVYAVVEVVIAT